MGLTAQIARFIVDPSWTKLDNKVLRSIRFGFVDTVAVMMAGSREPVVQVLRPYVASQSAGRKEARLLMGPERGSTGEAALVNGTAAHALDYDDVGLCGHPSAVLVPALLAEGERLRSSGAQLLRSYLIGYEVWAELIGRDADQHHVKGWHPTSVFGGVAVAAAVSNLRGVSLEVCSNALGIAASQAGGLVANFGSMTKPYHAGRAAASGIQAVDLAMAGMQAAPDVLEHHSGFLAALSPHGRFDAKRPVLLGEALHFERQGLTVKKYPMCFATHRIIDAALDMVHAHDVDPDQIESIQTTIGTTQASMLRNHAPQSALEAKFSIEFAAAAAVVSQRLGLAELQDDYVRRADVQAMMRRVQVATTDTVNPVEPSLSVSDRLVIVLKDGRRLDSGEVFAARGGADSPLTAHDLRAKFLDCAASVSWPDAESLFEALMQIDRFDDVSALFVGSMSIDRLDDVSTPGF